MSSEDPTVTISPETLPDATCATVTESQAETGSSVQPQGLASVFSATSRKWHEIADRLVEEMKPSLEAFDRACAALTDAAVADGHPENVIGGLDAFLHDMRMRALSGETASSVTLLPMDDRTVADVSAELEAITELLQGAGFEVDTFADARNDYDEVGRLIVSVVTGYTVLVKW